MKSNFFIKKNFFLFFFIIVGIFFRFYNLTWGAPFFFNPDERNIASAISQIDYPNQLNPHFFAYGSLPIYSIYFTGVFVNKTQNLLFHAHFKETVVSFENAIIIGRLYSFFLSVLTLPLIYILGKKAGGANAGRLSVILASLSVGFIQYSHFSTFEMWLSCFTLLITYVLVRYYETKKDSYLFLGSIILGFLLSIKISSIAIIPLCIGLVIFYQLKNIANKKRARLLRMEVLLLKITLFLGMACLALYFTSPFFWFDNAGFRNSMNYESSVALGKFTVFYTQAFLNTRLILFQLQHVFPFLLNPFLAISFILVIPFVLKLSLKKGGRVLLIVFLFFLFTFFSQVFIFVKWTRYYVPALGFIYILVSIGLESLLQKIANKIILGATPYILILVSLFYAFSYYHVVLASKDTRILAANWARANIPANAKILTEPFDIGIVPFNPYFSSIKIFDFYALDESKEKREELKRELETTEYIVLPSQRIVQSRFANPNTFPYSGKFYSSLFNNKTGYTKVYETQCNFLCTTLYGGDASFAYEQTTNVFDRPTVFIFRKNKQ